MAAVIGPGDVRNRRGSRGLPVKNFLARLLTGSPGRTTTMAARISTSAVFGGCTNRRPSSPAPLTTLCLIERSIAELATSPGAIAFALTTPICRQRAIAFGVWCSVRVRWRQFGRCTAPSHNAVLLPVLADGRFNAHPGDGNGRLQWINGNFAAVSCRRATCAPTHRCSLCGHQFGNHHFSALSLSGDKPQ